MRPADLSSPRDTLSGFLRDITVAITAWRENRWDDFAYLALRRSRQALDFSTLPQGDTAVEQSRRMLMLKEILDRLTLPPPDEIPGAQEVAQNDLTHWIVPGTPLTIARIESGPRSGAFVFSADTVVELERYFQLARDLPYQDDSTAGFYDEFLASDRTTLATQQRVASRLRPIDTGSPRSTLEGFLSKSAEAYRLILGVNQSLGATLPGVTREEGIEIERRAEALLFLAMDVLDLSEVPAALRQDVGIETVLMLKEVIDRLPAPLRDAVPDERAVLAARHERDGAGGGPPLRWSLPGTDIEIMEIQEGPRAGHFLFSARTVARVGDFYSHVRDLPYSNVIGQESPITALDYIVSPPTEDFFPFYQSSGGYLVPNAYWVGRAVTGLPSWLKGFYAGQALWQWLGLAVAVIGGIAVSVFSIRTISRFSRRVSPVFHIWTETTAPLIVIVAAALIDYFVDSILGVTGAVLAALKTVIAAVIFIMAAWLIIRLFEALAETLIASRSHGGGSINPSLVRVGARVGGALIGAWILIDGIQGLGVQLVPLLAGLGVGGLAVALAAQSVIANFIGGLLLFSNRPVRVGDFCRYGEEIGTVEDIGLYSTRIRSLERSVITVPNAEFAAMKLDNYTKRDSRLFSTMLGLRYETTPEQMRFVLARLREMFLGHPRVDSDAARVRFAGFGAYSKDIEVFVYLRCQDHEIFCALREDILLRIDDIVAEAGAGFAFPSQTNYITRDPGMNEELAAEAVKRVNEWRIKGKLPFPEFEEEERERLQDVLDYPPRGSPDAA